MKEFVHYGYDMPQDVGKIDDCFMSNLDDPVVRSGGETFRSYYTIEWCYHGYHTIDPSRSIARVVFEQMYLDNDSVSLWPACDRIGRLLCDLGFDWHHPSKADSVAVWTMFPYGTPEFMAKSYWKRSCYLEPHQDVLRVVNNPFFYRDKNASDGRLVEIAEENGFRYALDRSKYLASPDVIAAEIALLNYGYKLPTKRDEAQQRLATQICESMENWGLIGAGDV